MDMHDLVIADLAKELSDLEANQLTVMADGVSYRHLACAALDALAELTKRGEVLERRCRDLQDQIRFLMGLDDQTRD